MPHERNRYLTEIARKALAFSKIVGILGQRQVGKTTFLNQLAVSYLSLDDPRNLEKTLQDPMKLLKGNKGFPTAIDEAQLAPNLFPALKEYVRVHPKPGRFLLSGSVRFTSRRAIRESLTGRILNLELLPFSISELEGEALPDWAIHCMKGGDFRLSQPFRQLRFNARQLERKSRLIEQYLISGGLPGICFIREPKFREAKLIDQIYTLLDRDLRLILPTSLGYAETLGFLRALARSEGEPISHSDLRRETGISPVTQKKLLYALDGLFLIRTLLIEGGRKGMLVIFEDQAEQRLLSEHISPGQYDYLIFRNVRVQWNYRMGESPRYFHFLTRGRSRIPFAVQTKDGILGFVSYSGKEPSRSVLASIGSFLKVYERAKVVAVSIDAQFQPRAHDSRTLLVPLAWVV